MATNKGTREINQDRVFAKTGHINDMPCGLFCVADGMGGLQDGDYAASVVIDTMSNWWDEALKNQSYPATQGEILYALLSLLQSINDTILGYAKKEKSPLGTTCSLLLILNNHYYIAHAGDSRIYQMETKQSSFAFLHSLAFPASLGFFTKIHQLTEDHSWAAEQTKKGVMSLHDIEIDPRRNMLTSCLGVYERPKIFTHSGTIDSSCLFLLCSDGLYRVLQDKELLSMTRYNKQCESLTEKMIAQALKQGASDNVSLVVVMCMEG